MCVVEGLDIFKSSDVIRRQEVDGHTFATESATATNAETRKKVSNRCKHEKETQEGQPKHLPVNVVFTVVGQVIVDDEGHLLDVDAASEEIGGDEHTAAARAELAHNDFALVLIHVSMLKHA